MDNAFNNKYKNKFNQLDTNAPDGVWENISEGLDMEDVWQNVNLKLNKTDRKKRALTISSVIIAFVVMSSGLLLLNKQHIFNDKIHAVNSHYKSIGLKNNFNYPKKNNQHISTLSNTLLINSVELVTSKQKDKTINLEVRKQKKAVVLKNLNTIKAINTTTLGDKPQNDYLKIPYSDTGSIANLSTINTVQFDFISGKETPDSLIDLVYLKSKTNDNGAIISHSIIVGVVSSNYNSWLLNSDTYSGLKKNTLNQTLLSFGNSYGIYCNYGLSKKYNAQIEWVISNKQNQNYIDYTEGLQVNRAVHINYTQLNVLIKKLNERLIFKGKIPASLNYVYGLQYGYLTSCMQTIEGETNSIKNNYKQSNVSVVLGIEYQITLKKSWILFSGIRTDIGLRNIYAGSATIPSNFNQTYNSSIGFNVGAGYKLSIK